jgi:hypothetical protein
MMIRVGVDTMLGKDQVVCPEECRNGQGLRFPSPVNVRLRIGDDFEKNGDF